MREKGERVDSRDGRRQTVPIYSKKGAELSGKDSKKRKQAAQKSTAETAKETNFDQKRSKMARRSHKESKKYIYKNVKNKNLAEKIFYFKIFPKNLREK